MFSGMRLELCLVCLPFQLTSLSELRAHHQSRFFESVIVSVSEVDKSMKTQHSCCLSFSFHGFLFQPPQTVIQQCIKKVLEIQSYVFMMCIKERECLKIITSILNLNLNSILKEKIPEKSQRCLRTSPVVLSVWFLSPSRLIYKDA